MEQIPTIRTTCAICCEPLTLPVGELVPICETCDAEHFEREWSEETIEEMEGI